MEAADAPVQNCWFYVVSFGDKIRQLVTSPLPCYVSVFVLLLFWVFLSLHSDSQVVTCSFRAHLQKVL